MPTPDTPGYEWQKTPIPALPVIEHRYLHTSTGLLHITPGGIPTTPNPVLHPEETR